MEGSLTGLDKWQFKVGYLNLLYSPFLPYIFGKEKEKCYNIFQTVCLDLYISVEVDFGGLMSVETYFVVLHFCTFQNQVADKFSLYEDFNLKPTKL